MITGFDDEGTLLEKIQQTSRRDICLFSKSRLERQVYKAFFHKRNDKKIKKNFGKDDPPPDFILPDFSMMADMIQINDYETKHVRKNGEVYYRNDLKQEENRAYCNFMRTQGLEQYPGDMVHIVANPPGAAYFKYHNGFSRAVKEHASKINSVYKKNFPQCDKVGFIIFDDSHFYLHNIKGNVFRPHLVYRDYEFLKVIKESGAQFVIWFFSNKIIYTKTNPLRVFPSVVIIDVDKIDLASAIHYKKEFLICAELTDRGCESLVSIFRKE